MSVDVVRSNEVAKRFALADRNEAIGKLRAPIRKRGHMRGSAWAEND